MPEYLKWAHTAVLKATVIRSKATLLYALSILVGEQSEINFWRLFWMDYVAFWYNLWFLMVILTFENDKNLKSFE